MDFVWHYTDAYTMPLVLSSGRLRAKSRFGLDFPAVWFSKRTDVEPTSRALLPGREGEVQRLVRIAVKSKIAPYGWDRYRRRSGLPEELLDAMAKTGQWDGANEQDWFVRFGDVMRGSFVHVQERCPVRYVWTEVPGWQKARGLRQCLLLFCPSEELEDTVKTIREHTLLSQLSSPGPLWSAA